MRRRWFPFPTDNVVLFGTLWARHAAELATYAVGGSEGWKGPTLRHEATHIRQYHERGWWWVWTNPTQREAEARAAQTDPRLTVEVVG